MSAETTAWHTRTGWKPYELEAESIPSYLECIDTQRQEFFGYAAQLKEPGNFEAQVNMCTSAYGLIEMHDHLFGLVLVDETMSRQEKYDLIVELQQAEYRQRCADFNQLVGAPLFLNSDNPFVNMRELNLDEYETGCSMLFECYQDGDELQRANWLEMELQLFEGAFEKHINTYIDIVNESLQREAAPVETPATVKRMLLAGSAALVGATIGYGLKYLHDHRKNS